MILKSDSYYSAVEGEDFTFIGPQVFTFNAITGNLSCITINITNDDDFEGDHSFTVELANVPDTKRSVNDFSNPEGPIIGSSNVTTVSVNDAEGMLNIRSS